MSCHLHMKILAARDLPVMDQATGSTDAFVEIRVGKEVKNTEIKRKDLNPKWEAEFEFFVVDINVLYTQPVEFRVMDHDRVGKGDSIGTVRVDITNVLVSGGTTSIGGWFPIYDTLRGNRGQLNIKIKARFTRNDNEFKQKDTAGVRFITTSDPSDVYRITKIFRFVEELVVEADPEHKGAESFRFVGESRKDKKQANEQRLNTLYRLSGKLQQQIALRVVTMGGNAVLGYTQEYDFECVGGIIARGYGTACKLKPRLLLSDSLMDVTTTGPKLDKPTVFVPPPVPNDVTILTIRKFAPIIGLRIAGIVSVRAVKLLKASKVLKYRDKWWAEVRAEIKQHATALSCNYIFGYSETTSIHGDTCIVSASGTACYVPAYYQNKLKPIEPPLSLSRSMSIDLGLKVSADKTNLEIHNSTGTSGESVSTTHTPSTSVEDIPTSPKKKEKKKKKDKKESGRRASVDKKKKKSRSTARPTRLKKKLEKSEQICSYAHVPYKHNSGAFPMKCVLCNVCKKKYVPELLFSSTEIPSGIPIVGKGNLVHAKVCLEKKSNAVGIIYSIEFSHKKLGEVGASNVSDMLPFLEYDLHRHLVFKLKMRGMNAIFGLKYQISIGPSMIIGTATGTAVYLLALPAPPPFQIRGKEGSLQSYIKKQSEINREAFKHLIETDDKQVVPARILGVDESPAPQRLAGDNNESDSASEDLLSGAETAFIVEMDDEIDDEALKLLVDSSIPDGFYLCNTETLPGGCPNVSNIQMIQMYTRARLPVAGNKELASVFDMMFNKLLYRLRGMHPCVISGINTDIQQYDELEVTLGLTAMALLEKPEEKHEIQDQEVQFSMEEDDSGHRRHHKVITQEPVMPKVILTPLSIIPDSIIDRYYGRINLHFIREATVSKDTEMGSFLHFFLADVNNNVRANVHALGANALLGYRLEEFILTRSQNEAYGLISLSGDAVLARHVSDGEGFKKLAAVN